MAEAGWYPDPSGAPGQRWWDGAQWTEHVHAAAPEPATETPAPKKGRGKKIGIIVGVAVALVVALVLTFSVVAIRGFLGLDRQFALPTEAEPVADRGYAMTEPLLNVSTRSSLTFPAKYDFDARSGKSLRSDWAFELFLDPALTNRASVSVFQSQPGADLSIRPNESREEMMPGRSEPVAIMSPSSDWQSWGLEPEYYFVRHVDEKGDPLETPVVTKVTTESTGFAEPSVQVSADAETGALELSWAPVEGATEYVVVGSFAQVSDNSSGRLYTVLGTTSETSWSSKDDVESSALGDKQNVNLVSFDGESADEITAMGAREDDWNYESSAYRWGVIANDGDRYSRVATADADEITQALPYEVAEYAMGGETLVFDEQELRAVPPRFAFTSLDGLTRQTQAVIPEGGIEWTGNRLLTVSFHGVGTQLTHRVEWSGADPGFDTEAFRADYNARAAAAVPTTGGSTVISKSLEEVAIDSTPVSEPADVAYPVHGSDDYVRFLAGHMIAGTRFVDVTAFARAAGAQSLYDALEEAQSQNAYVVGVGSYGTRESDDSTVLWLEYDMDEAERTAIQQSIKSSVDGILASVVTDGMSARDKAVAINDWVTGNVEYDYTALANRDATGSTDGFEYAWRADGVFERGTAVCAGYSFAYATLMNAAGVETVYVTGDVFSAGRHAWNKVLIDGSWWAVDTTWNDTPDGNRYLLISDAGFTGPAERVEDGAWVRDDALGNYRTP